MFCTLNQLKLSRCRWSSCGSFTGNQDIWIHWKHWILSCSHVNEHSIYFIKSQLSWFNNCINPYCIISLILIYPAALIVRRSDSSHAVISACFMFNNNYRDRPAVCAASAVTLHSVHWPDAPALKQTRPADQTHTWSASSAFVPY